jgi:hypothetical protein
LIWLYNTHLKKDIGYIYDALEANANSQEDSRSLCSLPRGLSLQG